VGRRRERNMPLTIKQAHDGWESCQDDGGPFAIRYYLYCVGVVIYIISAQGCPTNINGSSQEVWFLVFTVMLNLSFWAYLMGSVSGRT